MKKRNTAEEVVDPHILSVAPQREKIERVIQILDSLEALRRYGMLNDAMKEAREILVDVKEAL